MEGIGGVDAARIHLPLPLHPPPNFDLQTAGNPPRMRSGSKSRVINAPTAGKTKKQKSKKSLGSLAGGVERFCAVKGRRNLEHHKEKTSFTLFQQRVLSRLVEDSQHCGAQRIYPIKITVRFTSVPKRDEKVSDTTWWFRRVKHGGVNSRPEVDPLARKCCLCYVRFFGGGRSLLVIGMCLEIAAYCISWVFSSSFSFCDICMHSKPPLSFVTSRCRSEQVVKHLLRSNQLHSSNKEICINIVFTSVHSLHCIWKIATGSTASGCITTRVPNLYFTTCFSSSKRVFLFYLFVNY